MGLFAIISSQFVTPCFSSRDRFQYLFFAIMEMEHYVNSMSESLWWCSTRELKLDKIQTVERMDHEL